MSKEAESAVRDNDGNYEVEDLRANAENMQLPSARASPDDSHLSTYAYLVKEMGVMQEKMRTTEERMGTIQKDMKVMDGKVKISEEKMKNMKEQLRTTEENLSIAERKMKTMEGTVKAMESDLKAQKQLTGEKPGCAPTLLCLATIMKNQ